MEWSFHHAFGDTSKLLGMSLTTSLYITTYNVFPILWFPQIRAGPLLGSTEHITLHCYLDHGYVTLIVNNQTALTALAQPSSGTAGGVSLFGWKPGAMGTAVADLWRLRDASIQYR